MDTNCKAHGTHNHTHGTQCGHQAVMHENHTDYLHDGHMHHVHGEHVDEHSLSIGSSNPNECTPGHTCQGHNAGHSHSPTCGHERVPHGDHVDFLVAGHLHHSHDGHCDDHGFLKAA